MVVVGIRELRQRASELLRRVETGETFEITDRGRPVAILGPLPDGSPLERLRGSGDLTASGADLESLPEPLLVPEGHRLPSLVLVELRRDDR